MVLGSERGQSSFDHGVASLLLDLGNEHERVSLTRVSNRLLVIVGTTFVGTSDQRRGVRTNKIIPLSRVAANTFSHEKSPPNGELLSWRSITLEVWNFFAKGEVFIPLP